MITMGYVLLGRLPTGAAGNPQTEDLVHNFGFTVSGASPLLTRELSSTLNLVMGDPNQLTEMPLALKHAPQR